MTIIVEPTNNPIYVCNVKGRVDAVEYRARVGQTEIACFWVRRPAARFIDDHPTEYGEAIGRVVYYLPMRSQESAS